MAITTYFLKYLPVRFLTPDDTWENCRWMSIDATSHRLPSARSGANWTIPTDGVVNHSQFLGRIHSGLSKFANGRPVGIPYRGGAQRPGPTERQPLFKETWVI